MPFSGGRFLNYLKRHPVLGDSEVCMSECGFLLSLNELNVDM